MKKALFLLLALGLFPVQAATLPQASSFISGAGTTSITAQSPSQIVCPLTNIDTCGVVLLCGGNTAPAAADFYGLYSLSAPTTNAQYQVPAGKTFYGVDAFAVLIGTNACIKFGYGPSKALSAEGVAASPSGSIEWGGPTAGGDCSGGFFTDIVSSTGESKSAVGVQWPALSYPFWKYQGGASIANFCIRGIVK